MLVPGVQKTDFPDFSGIFTIKMGRKFGNGISSETTRKQTRNGKAPRTRQQVGGF